MYNELINLEVEYQPNIEVIPPLYLILLPYRVLSKQTTYNMLTPLELYCIEPMFKNPIIMPKVRRCKVKVKVVNSAGFVLDFDSIGDAHQHLKPNWRDPAIVAYGKDQLGKICEYLFVPPTDSK